MLPLLSSSKSGAHHVRNEGQSEPGFCERRLPKNGPEGDICTGRSEMDKEERLCSTPV